MTTEEITGVPGSPTGPRETDDSYTAELRRGFVAMMPLWAGAMPFAVAFAVIAAGAGFSVLEIQALSALLFAGSAQLAVVNLAAAGSATVAIVATVFFLNLRHLLYGMSLQPHLDRGARTPLPLLAFLLTDEAYGVAIRDYLDGRGSDAFLLGAGVSLYVSFGLATLAGSLLGAAVPEPQALGLDVVFPLSFLALLLPLLRTRRHLLVAVAAGGSALLSHVTGGGMTILLSALVAAAVGAALDGRQAEAHA